jgi:hypothetical protein
MKRIVFLIGFFAFLQLTFSPEVFAQGRFIRRLQEEAEKKAAEELLRGLGNDKSEEERREESRRLGSHNREGGLSVEAPDVAASIGVAESAYSGKDFRGTKIALRDAIWGVELEIGQNVLASLPESVSGLRSVNGSDNVTSTGMGFVGLLIERLYESDDLQLQVSIGNDAAILGVASLMLAGEYARQQSGGTNYKQIRFQEHQAHIEYDDYSGYSLAVPFGQSSIFVIKGVNFGSEQEFMSAANQFNINTIKQKLGEK